MKVLKLSKNNRYGILHFITIKTKIILILEENAMKPFNKR